MIKVKEKIKEKISKQSEDTVEILSNKVFYLLSKFTIEEDKFIKIKDSIENIVLFEAGCYLMFCIDVWHHFNKQQENRSIMVNSIMDNFIILFQDIIQLEKANKILANRLKLYSQVANRKDWIKESIDLATELTMHTIKNEELVLFNVNKPMPIALGGLGKWAVSVNIQEYFVAYLPLVKESLEEFYSQI